MVRSGLAFCGSVRLGEPDWLREWCGQAWCYSACYGEVGLLGWAKVRIGQECLVGCGKAALVRSGEDWLGNCGLACFRTVGFGR